ncbi:MAG: ABC transporter ATP-binding protein [Leptospiraceae bacterium]|nr:ABC transporter ATP-binding protein [Leptospiraceae bacterium]
MSFLTLNELSRTFGDFVAVDRVSFEVQRGEIFGFLGANGAGKSTVIRMLCGILPPSGGTATLDGIDIGQHPGRIKKKIGYMSQKFSLYGDLTVRENIRFSGGIHRLSGPELQRREAETLELAGLRGKEKVRTDSLPGGWKQRLALGCSMLHRPDLLFLDEPTAGVDPQARRDFWELIFDLRLNGCTIFVTTHYMDEVEQCDRIALMHRGRVVALDSPEALKTNVIPGSVYSIQCDDQERARPLLSEMNDFARVDPFGRGFHAITDGKRSQSRRTLLARVSKTLSSNGVRLTSMESIKPALEDVFVYKIGELERNRDERSAL